MGLLTNLVTQIAQNAIQGHDNTTSINNPMTDAASGLGGMFGGSQASQIGMGNGGLDSVLGSVLGGNMGGLGGMSQGGILGQVLGSVLGGGMGSGMGAGFGNSMGNNSSGFGGKSMLMAALLPMALMFIQRNGGLSGAINKINSMGFGHQTQSWMNTDTANQVLDTNAVSQLFDHQELAQVAAQTGVDQTQVTQSMAELLPQVFDHLTPNGDIQTEGEANNEINEILSQLSQFK